MGEANSLPHFRFRGYPSLRNYRGFTSKGAWSTVSLNVGPCDGDRFSRFNVDSDEILQYPRACECSAEVGVLRGSRSHQGTNLAVERVEAVGRSRG